jgi:hypothetical protein
MKKKLLWKGGAGVSRRTCHGGRFDGVGGVRRILAGRRGGF